MFVFCVVATIVLAAMLVMSAALKLRRDEQAVHVIHDVVGVPLRLFPPLAAIQLAGAVGVIAGLWLAPVGIAARVGVVVYFVLAAAAHVRVGDVKGITHPMIPLVAAAVARALRAATT